MGSRKDETGTSRRAFFQEVTTGTAAVAVASALAQLGAPVMAAAQEAKTPGYVGIGTVASGQGGGPAPKEAESPFFKNPPPWPKGTDGHIYDNLFSTKLKENTITDVVAGPQAYFRGDSDLPGAKINMGWQMFTKPYKLERESHHHDCDEYLFFLGATLPDLVGSFDAEIEYFMGKEYERHIITKATVLYIPAGVEHNPCDIRRVSKPLLFSALELAPYFNGVYQTMGYMELKGMKKI
ncbi:MAG: hypothetical protein ABSC60_13120 [Acidobacteriota bacterium]|jgi:mannose-6-phosphate isomerase-like protein (cupin superfamily)